MSTSGPLRDHSGERHVAAGLCTRDQQEKAHEGFLERARIQMVLTEADHVPRLVSIGDTLP